MCTSCKGQVPSVVLLNCLFKNTIYHVYICIKSVDIRCLLYHWGSYLKSSGLSVISLHKVVYQLNHPLWCFVVYSFRSKSTILYHVKLPNLTVWNSAATCWWINRPAFIVEDPVNLCFFQNLHDNALCSDVDGIEVSDLCWWTYVLNINITVKQCITEQRF